MGLDTNIAMSGPRVEMIDPLTMYAKGAGIQHQLQQNQLNQLQMEKHQQDMEAERTLADLYRGAMKPDGTVDRQKVLTDAANRGLGAKIPGLQKSFIETDKAQADVDEKRSITGKNVQEVVYNGLKHLDSSLSSLLANPNVDERAVYSEVGRLVKLGAFNGPAQHMNVSPDDAARQFLSTMPVGDPAALRSWLVQAGMRTMDATKRVELQLPKYDLQDRGGTLNEGTINLMTGQRTEGTAPGQTIVPTPTAGQVLADSTKRYEIGVTDSRARETNDINREATQSQIVETPQGYAVVNKSTTLARPVANAQGQPVLTKDSSVMKNAQMADRLTGMIPYARTLLTGKDATGTRVGDSATASGIGAGIDYINNKFGMGTKSGDAASALEVAAGWMTSNVPRFEGPQSDKDTATYRTMAGQVGDRTLPMSTRLKALDAVENLMKQYKVDPGTDRMIYSGPPGTQPATRVAPPALPGTGPTLAGRRGSSPMGRGVPAPAQQSAPPDINSFFK